MCQDSATPAVACSLSQNDLNQRAARWQALADYTPAEVTRTDRGLRLKFALEATSDRAAVISELERLADLERDCCAFATWTLRPSDTEVVLDVSAIADDAIEATQAMFAALAHVR